MIPIEARQDAAQYLLPIGIGVTAAGGYLANQMTQNGLMRTGIGVTLSTVASMAAYPWRPEPKPFECANTEDISKLFEEPAAVETSELSFSLEQQGNVPCLIVTSGGKRYRFFGAEV